MNVREYYEHALAERGYQPDEAQLQAVERLQRYYDEWVRFKALRSNALKKLLNRPDVPRGVYLWGSGARQELPDGCLLCHRAGGAQDAPAFPRIHARRASRARGGQRAPRIRWTKWRAAWPAAIA